mmetsp:Transcript_41374/g.81742  ORF Transcript_41374/g.81742 Transcript_41374/m.81742 type:complete len:244 (-) Transcript_41374:1662-2393(-)
MSNSFQKSLSSLCKIPSFCGCALACVLLAGEFFCIVGDGPMLILIDFGAEDAADGPLRGPVLAAGGLLSIVDSFLGGGGSAARSLNSSQNASSPQPEPPRSAESDARSTRDSQALLTFPPEKSETAAASFGLRFMPSPPELTAGSELEELRAGFPDATPPSVFIEPMIFWPTMFPTVDAHDPKRPCSDAASPTPTTVAVWSPRMGSILCALRLSSTSCLTCCSSALNALKAASATEGSVSTSR